MSNPNPSDPKVLKAGAAGLRLNLDACDQPLPLQCLHGILDVVSAFRSGDLEGHPRVPRDLCCMQPILTPVSPVFVVLSTPLGEEHKGPKSLRQGRY